MRFQQFVAISSAVAMLVPHGFFSSVDASQPTVVVNELLWSGSPLSTADEWIELRNLTDAAVDLGSWRLTRLSSGSEVAMVTIPPGMTIAPSGFFLIANFSDTAASSVLAIAPDVVDSAVSLLNSGLQIKLYDAANTLVDVADDGVGSPAAGSSVSGQSSASMMRVGNPGDGVVRESWTTSTGSTNLKLGSNVSATPAAANDNVPPIVPPLAAQTVTVGQPVTFDATDTRDPDGHSVTLNWDFGDGASSNEPTPTHVYGLPGTVIFSLTVSDGLTSVAASANMTIQAEPATPSPASISSGRVELSELLPNPEGSDQGEFIELRAVDGQVDLDGWSLTDQSGSKYVFPAGLTIEPGAYQTVERPVTSLALNNDTDSVVLRRADGSPADEVTFSDAAEGQSYARQNGAWSWTVSPTPGAENVINRPNHDPQAKASISPAASKRRVGTSLTFDASDSLDDDAEALTFHWAFGDGQDADGVRVSHTYQQAGAYTVRLVVRDGAAAEDIDERSVTIRPPLKGAGGPSTPKTGSVKGAALVRTAAEAKDADSSTRVELTGWIIAPPNVLGSDLLYVTDGTSGIAVRSTIYPSGLAIGDAVTVSGLRRSKSGEPYVAVDGPDGIRRNAAAASQPPLPTPVAADALDQGLLGSLVELSGRVTSVSGSRFGLDDGTSEVTVAVKSSAGFARPALATGDRLRVVGVVASSASGLRILPRQADDISVIMTDSVAPPAAQPIVEKPPRPWWAYGLTVLGLAAAVAAAVHRRLREGSSTA